MTVWADPANNTKEIKSLGAAFVPLSKIANARFIDRDWTDPKTRQKISFQSRVLSETAELKSSFFADSSMRLTVELQMWFMKELPYPDIDLNSIKGSSANVFPREFSHKVMPDPEKAIYSSGEFH